MAIYIIRNEVQEGPYPLEQINQMLADKTLKTYDLAWYEGLDNWILVKDIPGVIFGNKNINSEYSNDLSPQLITDNSRISLIESELGSFKTLSEERKIMTQEGRAVLMRWGLDSIQTPKSSGGTSCTCPKCGSQSVQSVPVLCEGGSHTVNTVTRSAGVIIEGDGLEPVISMGRSSGNVVSALAQRLSPPKKIIENKTSNYLIFIFIVCPIIWVTVAVFIGAITRWEEPNPFAKINTVTFLIVILIVIRSLRKNKIRSKIITTYNDYDYPMLAKQWIESWYCHKCGYFGILG